MAHITKYAKVKFITEINVTDNPALLMVKFKTNAQTSDGRQLQSAGLATFELKNGKIIEYTEYNNPPQLAKVLKQE